MKKMKKWIIDIAKKNQLFRSFIRYIVLARKKSYYKKCCKKNKIQKNLLVFESYMGRSYACSPKAIYEEMIKDNKYCNYEFVWFFKDIESKKSVKELQRAKLIKYGSKDYYKYYIKARYFISNSRLPEAIIKRENQVYIQCWNGTPLKRLGYDLKFENANALNSLKDMHLKYKQDSQRYTYLLSPSEFVTQKFINCFNLKENNPNVKIIEQGYPRNDFLFNYNNDDIVRVKNKLGILNDNKKIILYAPTWRDNQHMSGIGYTYKTEVDFNYLREYLKQDYIILFRAHYFIANNFDFEKYQNFIYDVSKYDDINELYIISDILITDYSSVFFDFANLHRPMIFHMYDLEQYKNEIRGFYIDLKELPGNITKDERQLITEIINVTNNYVYNDKYKNFNDKFNYLDDGQASKRVLGEILNEE